MFPKSFTFKLTVPRDPQVAAIVADVAGHAVGYAGITAEAGADFVARVGAAAATALATSGPALLIVVTSDSASLTFTLDTTTVSIPHTA